MHCFLTVNADFDADNEIVISSRGNKSINIYKQNPVLNGYHIISELEVVLKSGYYKSPLGYENVGWFVDEVNELENKMAFFFKNTKKDIIMTEKDEKVYRNKSFCRFCEKQVLSDKFRDHCQSTGKYTGPAHNKFNIIVTQGKSNFIPFMFHDFSIYDCRLIFEMLVDKKMIK